jgi:hypothetical protein
MHERFTQIDPTFASNLPKIVAFVPGSHMIPHVPRLSHIPICSRSGFDQKTLELSGLHLGHCLLQSGWTFHWEGAEFADQNGCSLSGL